MEANCERGIENRNEPDNVMDEYAVCVKNNTSMVGRLPLEKKREICQDDVLIPQSRPR